jgi:hypothetical protein
MHYLLTPLHTHYDLGFGGVANSFKHAADLVGSPDSASPSLEPYLPASFLYRHAIELFLKSGIIIFHRKFERPYGASAFDSEPQVPLSGKWKAMYQVHSLGPLYERLQALFSDHATYLKQNTRTGWEFPSEMSDWIKSIDATDSSSTFFRYPVTKHGAQDATKSTMKEESYPSIIARMGPDSPPQKVFVVLDENENIVNAYRRDETNSMAMLQVLREVAGFLYGCHAAMRGELTGGW